MSVNFQEIDYSATLMGLLTLHPRMVIALELTSGRSPEAILPPEANS